MTRRGEFDVPEPDYESRVRSSFEQQRMMQTLGALLTEIAPGEVVIEFPYNPAFSQQNGYLHAGAVTAVVDSACGYAAYTLMPKGANVLTIEYKVNFMAPAKGEMFKGVGTVLRAGRTLTVCSGDVIAVEAGQETLVATMQATMIRVGG